MRTPTQVRIRALHPFPLNRNPLRIRAGNPFADIIDIEV